MGPSELGTLSPAELREAFTYRLVSRSLRSGAGDSVVSGVVAMALGFGFTWLHPLNLVLGAIGVFLTVEGLWIAFNPTPSGLIVDGLATMVVGALILSFMVFFVAGGGRGGDVRAFIVAPLVAWQAVSAFRRFRLFVRVRGARVDRPSGGTLRTIERLASDIAMAVERPGHIEFLANTCMGYRFWKGLLSSDSAVFVEVHGEEMMFAAKEDVEIVKLGEVWMGKDLRASFRIGEGKLTGTIAPDLFERYERWKAAPGE